MKPSRRQFLESTLGAALIAPLGRAERGLLRAAEPPAPQAPAGPRFPMPHFIRYDSQCFTINDRDTFIFGASFHYPRCPRPLWRDRLRKLRLAGFNTIETYVFWNRHEPEEGRVDLTEFEDFVKLVQEMGFWMIARPGPYVCAEWDAGGFPHWVVARRFPLRSNHPESIRTSQHWYGQVLPVIARHLVTHSGPIILVQIENEYDYWKLPDDQKRAYITALAETAWNAGIDVPLITCWTKQVRERSDPVMARIADFCNFYPRWNILPEVVPALDQLRREEPASPEGVVELQGGWFSEFGGRLSVDQEGVSAAQLNLLSKTVIEHGVTYFNYYMGFGGTNFDWAAKKLTTTYDYAAPLREPGGVWEKYYAARGVGASLKLFGDLLLRAQAVPGGARSTNGAVTVTERVNGRSGVLWVRENANAEQRARLSFVDPASPTHRLITTPREGEWTIGPREMKMLPVQIAAGDLQIRYTTAEILTHGTVDRPYLIFYDEPGRLVEIALATENEPHVEGDTVYQYWDPEYESAVLGLRVESREKVLLFNDRWQIVLLPRERALRTWTAGFPSSVVPAEINEAASQLIVPFISDAVLVGGAGAGKSTVWVELDFQPGDHDLVTFLPPRPAKLRVNGAETEFHYDRPAETLRARLTIPTLPASPIALGQVRTWVEKFDPRSEGWSPAALRALEDLGAVPYGYVKYYAEFPYAGEPTMFITAFTDDGKKVFINGRLAAEASVGKKQVEVPLARYAQTGQNTLEIAYEAFGSANFGPEIGDLKGIEAVSYGAEPGSAKPVTAWHIQRFPAAMRGRNVDPDFSPGGWSSASLGEGGPAGPAGPAFTWCRAEFTLEKPGENWIIPWKLTFEADRDALLYLNGKFVGRYVVIGPQKDFYLPEPYLTFGGAGKNILTVVLAYTDNASAIRALRIAPYDEFAAHRTRLEFEW